MLFLEVAGGVAVGMIVGIIAVGLLIRLGRKPDANDLATNALIERNALTRETNYLLGEIAAQLKKRMGD